MRVAEWLSTRPLVARVHCPAWPTDPGHDLWKRDFLGGNGLLSIEFDASVDASAVDLFVDSLELFGLGHSWGGYESLALPVDVAHARTLSTWQGRGPVVRLHVGLEDIDDLLVDLAQALQLMEAARSGILKEQV